MHELQPPQIDMREPLQAHSSSQANPLGLDGLEFIEYSTSKPQALGHVLEMMGFRPVAHHRSREVTLYRQGEMNIVVNAGLAELGVGNQLSDKPTLSAIALRVRDARAAYQYALDCGAWAAQTHAGVMELKIPAIHGVGGSRIYFVDRYKEFSIYDIDFVPIPSVNLHPESAIDISYFGLVQYIGLDRSYDWIAFYQTLFGAQLMPDEVRYGVLPKGKIMWLPALTPGKEVALQLIEPAPNVVDSGERLQRIGFAVADVPATVAQLRQRGMEFVDVLAGDAPATRGALTKTFLGSVAFELVLRQPASAAQATGG